MDYQTTPALADRYTHLLKPQWDLIHNPQSTTGLFDGMEEGASQLNELSNSNFFIRNGIKNSKFKFYNNDCFDGFSKSATFNKIVNLFTSSNSRVKTLVVKYGTGSASEASTVFGFMTVRKSGKSTYTNFEYIGKLTEERLSNAELAFRIGYYDFADELKFAHEFFVHVIKDIEDINKIYAESKNNADIASKLKSLPEKSHFVAGDGGDRDHYKMLKGECYLMTEYVREILTKETNYSKRYKILEDYIEDLAMYLEPKHHNLLKSFGGKEIAKKTIRNYLLNSFSEYKDLINELVKKHLK
ncbi:hypothetical protein [Tenuifilum thalassicum]|uniref:Uncharacterized protein n=1 Tax=Tenuifilum thalassicum TaxID=2590900 RepID=A0A7D3XZK0_9BACT|nr:hypothetical protein [Tenuifilum thalassicum]QKG79913.1 hypothetical protein FHG85_06435 [Tenuifilum thalassicum]